MGSEKRQEARFGGRSCFVECRARRLFSFLKKEAGDVFPLVNISEGGVQFLSHKDLAKNSIVDLQISIPGVEDALVSRARVAWVERMEGRDFYRVGAEFVGMSDEEKGRLLSLVKDGRLTALDLSRHATRT